MITCDDIIHAMVIESTKITNTTSTNVSINSGDKKVRYKIDCYIFHTVLLLIILLLIILLFAIIMQKIGQIKKLMHLHYKMEINEFKNVHIENRTCYYFNDIIKLKDFDTNNILIDGKLHKKYQKENFYASKKTYKNWDVNVNHVVISKLVKTKF